MAKAVTTIAVQQNDGTPIATVRFTISNFTKKDIKRLIDVIQNSTLRDILVGIGDTAIRLATGSVTSAAPLDEDVSADLGVG